MNPSEPSLAERVRRSRILRLAYQQANRHLVDAGLSLASAGVRADSPEMRAIDFALRRVNRAGGIESPKEVRHEPRSRFVRTVPGRDESVA